MAVSTGTLLTGGQSASTTGTWNSAAFTATANYLVIACHANGGFTATAGSLITVSDTFPGLGAWSTIASVASTGTSGDDNWRLSAWWATADGAPGTGTVRFVSPNLLDARATWYVITCTGHDPTAPISEVGTGTGNATTGTVTLVGVAAGNLAVGVVSSRQTSTAGDIGSGANEREISEQLSGVFEPQMRSQIQDGTDNVMDWSALAATNNLMIAWEIAASGAAPPGTFQLERIERHYPRGVMRGYMRGMA